MTGMNDCISRADAIRWVKTECNPYGKPTLEFESGKKVIKHLENMPPAQPTLYGYNIELLAYIARVMEKEGVTAEYAVKTFDDMSRTVRMIIEEAQQKAEDMMRITELVNQFPELKNRPADEVFKIAERQHEIEEEEARREMERYFDDNGDPRRYEYY